MRAKARKFVSRLAAPVLRHAARAYVAGPEFEDASRVALGLQSKGFLVTIGYWNGDEDSPRQVADAYLQSLAAMEGHSFDHLSIKLPALDYSYELLEEVMAAAQRLNVRIHFDSLGPETADRTYTTLDRVASIFPGFSITIPTRWKRSSKDIEWAMERNVTMRIVKGQWPETGNTNEGQDFIPTVWRLAGRVREVNIATHNPQLLADSLDCLYAGGTRANVELLYGLPTRGALVVARQFSAPVRFYIPFGYAWLPYCLSQAQKDPRIFFRMLKDSLFPSHGISPSRIRRLEAVKAESEK
jgi:proline dehydrogenase